MDLKEKYDRCADGFSAAEYADPRRYNARRAAAVFSVGPEPPAGATVLDLACGDASLADQILARGYRYIGVDASPGMCDAARRGVGDRGTIALGSFEDYQPPDPVDVTVMLRAMYLVEDRVAVLRKVASYTRTKVVFDIGNRQVPFGQIEQDVRAAGLDGFETRPFFEPRTFSPSIPLELLFRALERSGPLARRLAQYRGRLMCAAYRVA